MLKHVTWNSFLLLWSLILCFVLILKYQIDSGVTLNSENQVTLIIEQYRDNLLLLLLMSSSFLIIEHWTLNIEHWRWSLNSTEIICCCCCCLQVSCFSSCVASNKNKNIVELQFSIHIFLHWCCRHGVGIGRKRFDQKFFKNATLFQNAFLKPCWNRVALEAFLKHWRESV